MILRLDNIGISVTDVERVADFFERKLGLTVVRDLSGEPPSVQVQVEPQYLYVFETRETGGAQRGPDLTGNPRGLDHISFTVDDVDAAYHDLRGRGVEFEGEPVTEQAWGVRLAAFGDPEGNRYYLVQSL